MFDVFVQNKQNDQVAVINIAYIKSKAKSHKHKTQECYAFVYQTCRPTPTDSLKLKQF